MPNIMTTQDEGCSLWQLIPDSVLLHVFSYLPMRILLHASQVCKVWHRVAMDEYLWKDLLYRTWHIDPYIAMAPSKVSWLQEFKRLHFHTPQIESEVLHDHRDQVLHISFSHNGQMFATSSKDGYIKVWTASYPSHVKYYADMREFTWKYTQFSQFNETDTLLLVSGVHFGAHSTSGEIAVFNLSNGFELQSRVLNKPYDIFGTWYNETYLLSGNLHWLGHLTSCSVLWLNKASQALEAENESVVMRLYKFRNINASSIRTVMIAKCSDDDSGNKPSTVTTTVVAALPTATTTDSAMALIFKPSRLLNPVVPMLSSQPPVLATVVDAQPPRSPSASSSSSTGSACGPALEAVAPAVAQPHEPDISMKGAGTSQSECSQGKPKRKDSKINMPQKVQVMTDGDHGVRLLEVDDSNDDGEETIEYNLDYRRAELNIMDIMDISPVDIITQPLTPPQDIEMLEDCQNLAMQGESEGSRKRGGVCSLPLPHLVQTEPVAKLLSPQFRRIFSNISSHSDEAAGSPLGESSQAISSNSASSNNDMANNLQSSGTSGSCSASSSADSASATSIASNNGKTNNPKSCGVAKYMAACTSGDINVNTNSTGNNNSNRFSLHPHFSEASVSATASIPPLSLAGDAGEVPTLPLPPQPLPIGATCSASAPQPLPSTSVGCRMSELDFTGTGDRYLIFTTGMKTYTPHQIGIKRIMSLGGTYTDLDKLTKQDSDYVMREEFDTVDHLIELHGHIIGMCLSPDNRYLYVNSRPWPQGYEIDDPLYPPPIAQEIDIHVIDLTTMREVGTMLRAHKAYTPNDECFFIFLDVCQEYVASGAEDKHGYLWDRHYGVCLTKFPHTDVVNSVAFNPQDPEMLITASDDNSLKIWRSRNRELQVKSHLSKVTEP